MNFSGCSDGPPVAGRALRQDRIQRVLTVSSVASHVHAASSFASSLQLQTAGSTPDPDSDPFAAMLDAMVTGQDTVTGSGTAPSGKDQPSTPPTGHGTDNSPAQTADNTQASGTPDKPQSDPSRDTTSPPDAGATPSSGATTFTVKTGSNLIQGAAAKSGEKRGADIATALATGSQGKTGAASIADRLSKLLGKP